MCNNSTPSLVYRVKMRGAVVTIESTGVTLPVLEEVSEPIPLTSCCFGVMYLLCKKYVSANVRPRQLHMVTQCG